VNSKRSVTLLEWLASTSCFHLNATVALNTSLKASVCNKKDFLPQVISAKRKLFMKRWKFNSFWLTSFLLIWIIIITIIQFVYVSFSEFLFSIQFRVYRLRYIEVWRVRLATLTEIIKALSRRWGRFASFSFDIRSLKLLSAYCTKQSHCIKYIGNVPTSSNLSYGMLKRNIWRTFNITRRNNGIN